MNEKQTTRYAIILISVSLLWPMAAGAVGYRLPNQDPEAIARGNAFAATADNPSAIYYNPAGITQLEGNNIRAGIYAVTAGIDYTAPGPGGATATAYDEFQYVPELYYVFTPKNSPLSFGLGVYAPYGLALDWGSNPPFKVHAEKGKLTYLTINPVAAWKITDTLSIAAGPTINYSKADFTQGLSPFTNDRINIHGDGWGYGFNVGLRWQPISQLAFGVTYRYMTDVDYEGGSHTTLPPPFDQAHNTTSTIHFPQYIVAGISYRPTENWNIEFDLDWTDWDSVNSIPINGTPIGNLSLPLNYSSSFMYEIGVTRKFGEHWFGSVGFFYSENSSPDKDFNPIIPDTDLYLGSAGFGYHGKHWDWAIAYHFGYNPGREVKNDTSYPLANGTYEVFNQAVNVAVTFKF